MDVDDDLLFDDEDNSEDLSITQPSGTENCWKILIVDDEPEIHQITRLTLADFSFEDKSLKFLHAYNARDAVSILRNQLDVALVLLDVVMETEDAGLQLVQTIRNELDNHKVRIVLRTGQPGAAPERDVILGYDINDYVEKAELTAQKLFTVVVASLRAYRDILKLEHSRAELIESNRLLYEQRERLQVTLDSIGDAVFTTDANGCITHLNPVAETLTGWKIEECKGRLLTDIFNIVNADSRERVANPVDKVLEIGKIVGLANHTVLIRKDGTEYQIADSAAPILSKQGEILGVILVCRDVSREYQIEEALRRSQKMEAIGQLTGGIAHDFNNQLGVVIGYLDFLEEQFKNDQTVSKWINLASKSTLRCIDLTRQLLTFSRRQEKHLDIMDVNKQLSELKNMISRTLTPEIDVQYYLADNLWLTRCDVGDFQDAILNLVINSRDAMPNAGKLIVETSNIILDESYFELNPEASPGEYVQVMLSDTGIGMDKNTLEHIFEPFFTTKTDGKGTGLGMSMVYGFVKKINGHIKIYSEAGIGTTIRMYLPRSDSEEKALTSDESDMPSGSETILIVDDEVNLLELADKYLTDLGYRTFRADNADEALFMLDKEPSIQLLFSDVVMPGSINGYELAQKATQLYPKLKVLLTTGFTSKSIAQNGLACFTENLLNKPYRKRELAQRIRTILDK